MRKAFCILLCLIALSISGCATSRYTPDNVWHDEWETDFFEDWIGRQLRAMREPSLWERSQKRASASEIRLLVLPTFTPAISVRVSELPDDATQITVTKLDGAGGYEPGRIDYKTEIITDGSVFTALRTEFERLNFWDFPPERDTVRPKDSDNDDEDTLMVCADGTRHVLEALDEEYNFSTQHECNMSVEFQTLALLVLDIADINVDDRWFHDLHSQGE